MFWVLETVLLRTHKVTTYVLVENKKVDCLVCALHYFSFSKTSHIGIAIAQVYTLVPRTMCMGSISILMYLCDVMNLTVHTVYSLSQKQ